MKKILLGLLVILATSKAHALQVGDVEVLGKIIANEVHISTIGKTASIWFIDGTTFTPNSGTQVGFRTIFSTNAVTSKGADTPHPFIISTNTLQPGTTIFVQYLSVQSAATFNSSATFNYGLIQITSAPLVIGTSYYVKNVHGQDTLGIYLTGDQAGDGASKDSPILKFLTSADTNLGAGIDQIISSFTIQSKRGSTTQGHDTHKLAIFNGKGAETFTIGNYGFYVRTPSINGDETDIFRLGTTTMVVTREGNAGLNTATPVSLLDVSGGTLTVTSTMTLGSQHFVNLGTQTWAVGDHMGITGVTNNHMYLGKVGDGGAAAAGGSGSVSIGTGGVTGMSPISSNTAVSISFSSGAFRSRLVGTTFYLDIDYSSITAGGSDILAEFSILEFPGIVVDAIPGSATYYIMRSTLNYTASQSYLSTTTFVGAVFASTINTFAINPVEFKQQVQIPISGASLKGTGTNGAGDANKLAESSETLSGLNYDFMRFSPGTTQFAYFDYSLPVGFDGSTVTFSYVWTSTGMIEGSSVTVCLQCVAISDGQMSTSTVYAPVQSSSVCVSDVIQGTHTVHISAESGPITIGNTWTAGDYIQWRPYRDVGQDNVLYPLHLMEIRLRYNRKKANDY